MATGAGGAEHLVPQIRPAQPARSWWSTSSSITPAGGHRRRRRRGPGGVDPSGAAGEQLVEPSTSITPRGWSAAPAAPWTWCRGSVRPAGAQLVKPVELDHVQREGHRRRRRRAPGAVDPSGLAGAQLVKPVELDHSCRWPSAPAAPRTWCRGSVWHGRRAAGEARRPGSLLQVAIGAGGAEDLVPRIRPARPASSWWSPSSSITPAGGHRRRRRRDLVAWIRSAWPARSW